MNIKEHLQFTIESMNDKWEKEYTYGHWDENDNFVFHPLDSDLLYEKVKPAFGNAVKLIPTHEESILPGQSRFGGEPDLPKGVEWPHSGSRPFNFAAQINLGEIPGDCERCNLPEKGILYFFIMEEKFPWEGRVLFAEEVNGLKERKTPEGAIVYKASAVSFSVTEELPVPFSPELLALGLSNQEIEALNYFCEMCECSKMLGYPVTFQGTHDLRMLLEAEKKGISLNPTDPYESETGYLEEREISVEKEAKKYVLLLQLASEFSCGMNFCDNGIVYFLIHKDDLENKEFKNISFFLESH